MNRWIYPVTWLAVCFLLVESAGVMRGDLASEYYVSTDGNDLNPGTQELPFQTITRACAGLPVKAVDGRRSLPLGGVTIWIRAGTYRETVRLLTIATADRPVRFAAFPNEHPVVNGADILDVPWTVHEGKIYRAPTTIEFEQLFVDGQAMQEARWPNTAVRDPVRARHATCDQGTTNALLVDDALPPGDWNGAYVHINAWPRWGYCTKQIRNYQAHKSLDFSDVGWFDDRRQTRPGDPYWLFGALAGLDRATEWFREATTGMTYLWCPGDPNPAHHTIEIKRREHAFDLSGCQYVRVEGLRLFAAGIHMEGSAHCDVLGCHLMYPVYRRMVPPPMSWDADWKGSNCMSNNRNGWKDCAIAYCAGPGIDDRGAYNYVTNCIIHDVDLLGTRIGGITAGHRATGGEYAYNTIRDGGGSGIDIYIASYLRVEHNHIHDVGALTRESGLIWAGWTIPGGTVFAYNWLHDNLDQDDGDGICMEPETQDYKIHHNLVGNVKANGLKLNGPSLNNEVYNNTILSSCGHAFKSCCGDPSTWNQTGTKIINNIANVPMYFATGAGAPEQHHNGVFAVDANGWPTADSGAIDAGVVIPGITDGYTGSAPDIGCFEVNTVPWEAGADWEETTFTRVPSMEGFETGDLIEFDWQSGSGRPWTVTPEVKHSGFYSVRSGVIAQGERAVLSVTLDCRRGDIIFWRKVSCAPSSDRLIFSINSVEKARWSGEQDWARVSFPVAEGVTSFAWKYARDSSSAYGQEAAWVDDIEFPLP